MRITNLNFVPTLSQRLIEFDVNEERKQKT
jgi:hypothetical protein